MTTNEATLKIPALHYGSCAKTVAMVLGLLPSVEVTRTDLDAKLVHVRFNGSEVCLDRIREALDEAGFCPED